MSFNWNCPYCYHRQNVTSLKIDRQCYGIKLDDQAEGKIGFEVISIGCSNDECLKTSVSLAVGKRSYNNFKNLYFIGPEYSLFREDILPRGNAIHQPEFIPKAIRDDYYEACLIRDLSPKASATLIRRCIQGMIRDFTGIRKGQLIEEIRTLRKKVGDGEADRSISIESVDAIDSVRKIGNIGAHMEKDINLIVDVDPGEAEALIQLTEMLMEDWYKDREKRKNRLQRVAQISTDKEVAKKQLPAPEVPADILMGKASK